MPNYFPVGYQPAYYQPQYQTQPQYQQNNQMMQQQIQPQSQVHQQSMPAIQQGGFVRVQSENDARMYPVAPGNSVTFIDDNEPFCYVKTMDISQLDRPKFEKYRLVKVEDIPSAPQSVQDDTKEADTQPVEYALKSELEALRGQVEDMMNKLESQTPKKTVTKAKKEDDDNE